ncbi:MAG: hypothetical protein JXR88_06105 [Clostridia bacterium]|nr:hypothetical protein [Clostridia bacterium]
MDHLAFNLRKDLELHSESTEITLQDLVYNWYSPYAMGIEDGEEFKTYVSLNFGDEKFRSEYVDIPGNFINTRTYLESLIQ